MAYSVSTRTTRPVARRGSGARHVEMGAACCTRVQHATPKSIKALGANARAYVCNCVGTVAG